MRGEGGLFLTSLLRFKFRAAPSVMWDNSKQLPLSAQVHIFRNSPALWDILDFHFWPSCTVKLARSKEVQTTNMQLNNTGTMLPTISWPCCTKTQTHTQTHDHSIPTFLSSITGNTCPILRKLEIKASH